METEGTTDTTPRRRGLRGVVLRVISDGSLTKKASLNAAASTAEQIARIAAGLIISPILLTRLGDAAFGTWQVLQRLIGHTSPASGRPGEALKWTIAHEQRSADLDFKRRAVGNALAVWVIFLPLQLAIGGALAWLSPVWLDVQRDSYGTIRLAAGILVLDSVLFSLLYLPQSVLQGENLGYKRLGLSVILVFVSKSMLVLAVLFGTGLPGLAVATAIATLLWGVTYIVITRSRVAWFGVARPSLRDVRSFVGLSWWFLLWNLVMTVMLASDVVVLGVVASTTVVATYTLAKYLPQAITVAVATVIVAVMPGLGGIVGVGDLARAQRIREETISLIWLFTVATGTTVLLWEASFLDLWVGERYYPGPAAILTVMVMVLQFAMIRTDANIIDLTLNLRRKVLIGALAAVVSVALAWLFVGPMDLGIVGLALGFVLGRAIQSISYPWMIGKLLDISPARQFLGAVRPAIATTVLFGGAAVLGSDLRVDSWLGLVLVVGASAAVLTAMAFFAGLSAATRRVVWRRILRVVKMA